MSDSTFKKVNVNVNNIDDSVPRVNRTQKVSIGLDVSSFSDPISLEIKCQLAPTPLSPYQTETIERDRCKFQRPRKKQKNILGAVSEVQSGKQTLPKKQNRKGTRCESQTPMIRRIQGLLPAFGQASYKGQHGKVTSYVRVTLGACCGNQMYIHQSYTGTISSNRSQVL